MPGFAASSARRASRQHPASAENVTREEPVEPMPELERGTDHAGETRLMLVKTEGGDFKPRH